MIIGYSRLGDDWPEFDSSLTSSDAPSDGRFALQSARQMGGGIGAPQPGIVVGLIEIQGRVEAPLTPAVAHHSGGVGGRVGGGVGGRVGGRPGRSGRQRPAQLGVSAGQRRQADEARRCRLVALAEPTHVTATGMLQTQTHQVNSCRP